MNPQCAVPACYYGAGRDFSYEKCDLGARNFSTAQISPGTVRLSSRGLRSGPRWLCLGLYLPVCRLQGAGGGADVSRRGQAWAAQEGCPGLLPGCGEQKSWPPAKAHEAGGGQWARPAGLPRSARTHQGPVWMWPLLPAGLRDLDQPSFKQKPSAVPLSRRLAE